MRFQTPVGPETKLGVLLDAVADLNRFPGALSRAQLDSAPRQANARFVARDERRRNRVGRAALTLVRGWREIHNLSLAVFVEPKILQRSERNRFRDFTRYHVGGSAMWDFVARPSANLELRTRAGGDEALQDGPIQFYDVTPAGGHGTTLVANKREAANSAGAFVQQEVTWSDQWSLRGGVRYDNLWYISQDFIAPQLDAAKRFTRFTPSGSLSWRGGEYTLYAAVGGGVEAPAFNEIDPPAPFDTLTGLNPFLDAMRSTTYEVGARGAVRVVAGGVVRFDAAVYQIDIANDIVPFNGGAFFFTAGKSRRRGIELGVDWLPVHSLTLGGTATVTENQYLEYRNDLGNFDGRAIAGLPKAFASARARWQSPWGLSAELGGEKIGRYFADDANTAVAPSVTLLNATLGWRSDLGSASVRAFVSGNNLTDENYVASVFINGINGQYFEPGLPANVSAGLTVGWR